MNKIEINGRLTADAEVKNTSKGEIVTFTLADHRKVNGEVVAQFVPVALFGKAVEAGKELKKGEYIRATGRLQVARNEKDGKRYVNTNVCLYGFEKPAYKEQDDEDNTEAAEA